MRGPIWRIDDEDGDPELTGAPRPLVVTLRELGEALVRSWQIWVGSACLAGLLGLGLLGLVPLPTTASATLLMVAPNPNDQSAMSTDTSLLLTRVVAQRVVTELDLDESPEAFLATVTVTPVSDQVLSVSVEGRDEASALARARSLLRHYLQFRGEQLRSVSEGLVAGYEKRIGAMQSRVATLTREYDRLAAVRPVDQVRLSDIMSERAALTTQVTELQRAIEDASLTADAAIGATHVIDAPAPSSPGSARRTVLVGVSGMVVGGGIAVGVILARALTSEGLRRRQDVATALGVPVLVGVPALAQQGTWRRPGRALTARVAGVLRGHPRGWSEPLRRRHLDALVEGLATALPTSSGGEGGSPPRSEPNTLGVVAIDRVGPAAMVVRALADRLVGMGQQVLLVDLTTTGALAGRSASGASRVEVDGPGTLTLARPDGDPALATGPRRGSRLGTLAHNAVGDLATPWEQADIVLVLLEVDPGLDLDLLPTWVDRIVPLVCAGRPSRELLATVAALLEGSGVRLPFALLVGADRWDRSIGRPLAEGRPVGGPTVAERRTVLADREGGVRAVQTR